MAVQLLCEHGHSQTKACDDANKTVKTMGYKFTLHGLNQRDIKEGVSGCRLDTLWAGWDTFCLQFACSSMVCQNGLEIERGRTSTLSFPQSSNSKLQLS